MACLNLEIRLYQPQLNLNNIRLRLKGGTDTKGDMETEFGGHRVACPNVIINRTNFSFYSIKIRLETPEIKILSVALLIQAKKSECGTAQPSSILGG